MEDSEEYLFRHKGFYFNSKFLNHDVLENIEDFKIRDDDIFVITYPKSGSIWTSHILALINFDVHHAKTSKRNTKENISFFEYHYCNTDLGKLPSPRIFCSHLPYYLVPRGLKNKKAKIIYVYRNPKDVMNSYFHFSNMIKNLPSINSLDEFMKIFLGGKVMGGLWFDHITGWYENKDQFNILFMMYEEMKMDLRSSVLKICRFVGKELSDTIIDNIVRKASFENMKHGETVLTGYVIEGQIGSRTGLSFFRKGNDK
ncbi:amine sulfotransferase-like [Rhynchocyon petersi]